MTSDTLMMQKEPRIIENRLNDAYFKALFSNKDLTISFINSIFEDYPVGNKIIIKDLNFIDRELPATFVGGKSCRLDLSVETDEGVHIDVEVQLVPQSMLFKRARYYYSLMISRQLRSGEAYEDLKPCIIICIVDFDLKFGTTNYLTRYQFMELKEHVIPDPDADIFFLELPKWKKAQSQANKESIKTSIKHTKRIFRWLNYLTSNDSELEAEIRSMDPLLQEAHEMEARFAANDKSWAQYLSEEKARRDEAARIAYARNEAKEEIALNMLKKGVSLDDIKSFTGLTDKQLAAISKQLQ